MTIKIFYTLIAIVAFSFFSNTYSDEGVFYDKSKTIKELKENINSLDKTNIELQNEFNALNADYELKKFLRDDLTLNDINYIKKIVSEYNINKSIINATLQFKAKELLPVIEEKKLLLEEKRRFYSLLIHYINIDFKDKYLEYIKSDAKIFNEQNNITTNIIAKKEILNIKVGTIETKIQEHKDFINESIKKVIETRLDEKINNLVQNETFKILNSDSKFKVIDKTIRKVKIKLSNLENSTENTSTGLITEPSSSILDKKIQTYHIAVSKLENFRDSLK